MSKEDFKRRVQEAKALSNITEVATALGLHGWGSRLFCPNCQKAGPRYHKTPDLQLYKDSFHCFKCAEASGDALSLIQFALRCTFMEAVEWLEQRLHRNDLNKNHRLRSRETGLSYNDAKNIDHTPRTNFQPLEPKFKSFVRAFPGSPAEAYLAHRGFSLKDIGDIQIGYSGPGTWPSRPWCGLHRVVFPHTDPTGKLVNLYGRSIEFPGQEVQKHFRHTHLPGPKGLWRGEILAKETTVLVCEGAFDALAMYASGHRSVVALFGVHSFKWDWFSNINRIVLCLDQDSAGFAQSRNLSFEGILRRKEVFCLERKIYCGQKDLAEAFRLQGLSLDNL